MRLRTAMSVVPLAIALAGCPHLPRPAPVSEERQQAQQDVSDFVAWWLAPARVAPPTIDFEPREAEVDGIVARVTPLRPEDAAWNTWRDGTARLFNNRAALLFQVEIDAPAGVRWAPDETWLLLNGQDRLPASPSPEDLLGPLLRAALEQEGWVLDGDLVDRTRAAGPFRSAYLSAGSGRALAGVVAFPLADPEMQVVDVVVHLTVSGPKGAVPIEIHYE